MCTVTTVCWSIHSLECTCNPVSLKFLSILQNAMQEMNTTLVDSGALLYLVSRTFIYRVFTVPLQTIKDCCKDRLPCFLLLRSS